VAGCAAGGVAGEQCDDRGGQRGRAGGRGEVVEQDRAQGGGGGVAVERAGAAGGVVEGGAEGPQIGGRGDRCPLKQFGGQVCRQTAGVNELAAGC
jgi:hypothetical protein